MLTAADWVAAGFRGLVQAGALGLQPAEMARDLGVSEADFYRNFSDMSAFRAEILADWAARAHGDVMAKMATEGEAPAQLRSLVLALVRLPCAAQDAAIRAWARQDDVVAQALSEMDARRFQTVKALCLAAGVSDPEVPMLIYASSIGYAAFGPPERAEAGMLALLRMAQFS